MTTIEELNQSIIPIIVFDKKLEQFRDKVLFPEKLEKAKEILEKIDLPKKIHQSGKNQNYKGIQV
ncbi:MAG: hypothetical protein B6I19_09860 [Bacteroidetes bacterium 4572_114]|nr:MAG: hypothetical protein B6I19_09860 [Bacteroidetes bacterium 4572_114]